jgi:hypothetical protein
MPGLQTELKRDSETRPIGMRRAPGLCDQSTKHIYFGTEVSLAEVSVLCDELKLKSFGLTGDVYTYEARCDTGASTCQSRPVLRKLWLSHCLIRLVYASALLRTHALS